MSNTTIECQQCDGSGVVTTMEPKALGRCSNGEMVYSSRTVPMNRFCDACKGTGAGETEMAEVISPAPVTFGGATIHAPGFTADQFERALCRAIADDLVVSIDATGQHIVGPRDVNGGYRTTRTSCDCRAGSCGQACKHRARLIAHLDIREPALRRQWAAAERSVSRKAVAA